MSVLRLCKKKMLGRNEVCSDNLDTVQSLVEGKA